MDLIFEEGRPWLKGAGMPPPPPTVRPARGHGRGDLGRETGGIVSPYHNGGLSLLVAAGQGTEPPVTLIMSLLPG